MKPKPEGSKGDGETGDGGTRRRGDGETRDAEIRRYGDRWKEISYFLSIFHFPFSSFHSPVFIFQFSFFYFSFAIREDSLIVPHLSFCNRSAFWFCVAAAHSGWDCRANSRMSNEKCQMSRLPVPRPPVSPSPRLPVPRPLYHLDTTASSP
jgi:hypothetical protein